MTARRTTYKRAPAIERFFRHVEPVGDCLLWTSTKAGQPGYEYGYFHAGDGRKNKVIAHRWIWEYLNGPVPDGMQVDHVRERGCVGYLCVKVAHLEVVTEEVNHERKRLKTCRSGKHDLTVPENVRWDENGRRRGCLICHQDAALARYHAKRNAKTAGDAR